jgi:phospholipase/lecithinase/hemolysin
MRSLALLPFIALSATSVAAVDRIIAYADSFTDNGNDYSHSGFPVSPPYWNGRFSNGPTWFEQVAKNLKSKGITVSNNGYGGATTNNADAYSEFNGWTVPGVVQQVETLDVKATEDSLFLIYIGYNDLNAIVNPDQYNVVNNKYSKEKIASNVVTSVQNIISKYSPKNILILNTPPFWQWPVVKDEDKPSAKELTESYNALVESEIKKIDNGNTEIKFLDDYSWWNEAIANPQQFGLETANGPCNPGIGNNNPCADPATHFFWDSYHPEAKAHKAFGDWATKQIESLYNID